MLPRKSTRLSRADKRKEVGVASENDKQKRKRSVSREDHGSGSRRTIKKTKDGRTVDNFCWKCHELGYDKICSTCPRVYHDDCLPKAGKFTEQDVCPECQLPSVDGTKPYADLTVDMMDKVLVCLLRRLMPATTSKLFGVENHSKGKFSKMNDKIPTKFPELMKWPERKYKTCKPIDLGMLIEAVKSGGSYSRTIEVFSDVQWIYHNSYKCFGARSEITKAANKIVKAVKNEIMDIEACHECYYRNYNEIELYDSDPFPLICNRTHTLVWAKLKGHPFWPSKCLKVIDGKAQIQFFGTHDKNIVEAKACYLMSREHPNPKYVGQKSYKSALGDLQFYFKNYERRYGPYPYAEDKVPFLPESNWHWVKEKPQFQSPSPKRKGARKSTNGRRTAGLENEFGGDSGPYIVISSIRGVSNEEPFQDNCEPQTAENSLPSASFCNYQNAANSWTTYPSQLQLMSNSSSNRPNLIVCIPRLDDSVAHQYQQKQIHQANSQVNISAPHPVITNLQCCDESSRSVRESMTMIEQRAPGPSMPSTSLGRPQALSHSQPINNISGFFPNDENTAHESLNARSSIRLSREELGNLRSSIGLNADLREVDPELLKIALDAGHFINDMGNVLLQYSCGYSRGKNIIASLVQKFKSIDSAFKDIQRKKRELRAKSSPAWNPIIANVLKGTKEVLKVKADEEFKREKKRLDTEIKNIENMLLFHVEEHLNYIRRTCFENCRSKGIQVDELTKEATEICEKEIILEKMNLEKEYSDNILEIRSQVWCMRCQELGKIYCCWNTYYCTEDCRIKHLAIHQPSCRKEKSFSGQGVRIEEIMEAFEHIASENFPVPMIEET